MNGKILALSLAITLGVSLAGASAMGEEQRPWNTWDFPSQFSRGAAISGEVTNIDTVNNMVQIRDAIGMIQTIRPADSVQILRREKLVHLSDLDLGDPIRVTPK